MQEYVYILLKVLLCLYMYGWLVIYYYIYLLLHLNSHICIIYGEIIFVQERCSSCEPWCNNRAQNLKKKKKVLEGLVVISNPKGLKKRDKWKFALGH